MTMSNEMKLNGVYAIIQGEGLRIVCEGDHVARVRTAAKEAVPKLVAASGPVMVAIVRVEALLPFVPQLAPAEVNGEAKDASPEPVPA
jgi:hypothetical protein